MKKGNKEDANLLHAHLQPQTDSDNGAHATLAKHCLYKSGASLNTKVWSHESILIISTHLGEHKQSDVGQDLLLQDKVGSLAGRHLEELLKEERAVQVGPQLAHQLGLLRHLPLCCRGCSIPMVVPRHRTSQSSRHQLQSSPSTSLRHF